MPAAATMTTSPTTSGELAKPQSGTFVPVSVAALRDQTHGAVAGVERVQDSGRAERVDAAVAERRRRRADRRRRSTPRTAPRRGASTPARRCCSCRHDDDLVVAALLLRVDESPSTANDDQPGPIGRRHSSTGGDVDQSVSIRTPRTTPSRSGPRKPGHSTRLVLARSWQALRRSLWVRGLRPARQSSRRRRSSERLARLDVGVRRRPVPSERPRSEPARRVGIVCAPGPGAVPRASASSASGYPNRRRR